MFIEKFIVVAGLGMARLIGLVSYMGVGLGQCWAIAAAVYWGIG
jgi:hypothetical protein